VITIIDDLIRQYSSGIKQLEQYRRSLDISDPYAAEEAKTISEMLGDICHSFVPIRSIFL